MFGPGGRLERVAGTKGKRARNTKGKQEPKGRNHEREASTPGEPTPKGSRNQMGGKSLAAAHKLTASREILLWMTPSEAPKALQASECSELLDPTGASYWIFAQRQPGKFASQAQQGVLLG